MTAPGEMPSRMLQAALVYARRGWAVFPVHYAIGGRCSCGSDACASPAKHPMTANGLTDATTDDLAIMRWWGRWPEANVGIATWSGRLIVLDVDPRHGGEASFESLRAHHGDLEAPVVLTGGGGQHVYLRAPDDIVVTSRATAFGPDFPGIDVRASGGYVLAPPSNHISGGKYAWEASSPKRIPEAPAWVIAALRVQDRKPIPGADDGATLIHGERNNALARYAGRLRRFGTGVEAMTDALLAFNAKQVRPPLDEREVRQIAVSVGRYAPAEVPEDVAMPRAIGEPNPDLVVVDVADIPDSPDDDPRRYALGIENIDRGMKAIRPGEFVVIGARQGHGKTALAEMLAVANAGSHRVLFATLEMTIEDVRDRMIARLLKVTGDDVERMRKYGDPEYRRGRDVIDGLQLKFYRPTKRPLRSSAAVMAAAEQHGAAILIVDWTRRLFDWKDGRATECSAVVEAFSEWSKTKKITTVLLSQMNRDAQGRRPIESQLQDTGRLEQEAEKIILLHRPYIGDQRNDSIAEVIVAKNRRGSPFRGHVHWYGPTTTFFPMTKDEERNPKCCQSRKPA